MEGGTRSARKVWVEENEKKEVDVGGSWCLRDKVRVKCLILPQVFQMGDVNK